MVLKVYRPGALPTIMQSSCTSPALRFLCNLQQRVKIDKRQTSCAFNSSQGTKSNTETWAKPGEWFALPRTSGSAKPQGRYVCTGTRTYSVRSSRASEHVRSTRTVLAFPRTSPVLTVLSHPDSQALPTTYLSTCSVLVLRR